MSEQLSNKLLYNSQLITDLSTAMVPHSGQIPIGKALFYEDKKRIFVRCGRKFGKTEILIYSLYRWALAFPNSYCYYFVPFKEQVRDIVWANGRITNFLDAKLMKKYGVEVNNADFRITFRNGSFIKCDGTDNTQKSRGYTATGLSVVDEQKDINPRFFESFEPNLAVNDAPIIFAGTPPDESEECFQNWIDLEKACKESTVGFFYHAPSTFNPHISKEYFLRKESELVKRGDRWLWEKEYLAEFVRAGDRAIFPMLEEKHICQYSDMLNEVLGHHHDWNFHVAFDPGSSACFAVLFLAIHKYSRKVYALDEIYATSLAENSTSSIIEKTKEIINAIMPDVDRWSAVYDSAALWFFNEHQTDHDTGLFLNKCEKDIKTKNNKISLIKDMILGNFFYMSDKCEKLFWEMTKYATDDKGKIKKENDHLFDCLAYALNDMNYTKIPGERPLTEQDFMKDRRKITIEEDLHNDRSGFYDDFDDDLYDN